MHGIGHRAIKAQQTCAEVVARQERRKRMLRQRADLARQPYVQQILRSLAHPSTPSTHNTSQQLVALPVWRPNCAISGFCPVSAIHPNPHRIRTVDYALLPVRNACVAVATHEGAGRSPSFGLMSSIAGSRRGRLLLHDRLGQSLGASKTEGWIKPRTLHNPIPWLMITNGEPVVQH